MYNAVIQRPLLKVPGMKAPVREVQMDIHSEDDWLTVSLDLSGLAVTGATLSKQCLLASVSIRKQWYQR